MLFSDVVALISLNVAIVAAILALVLIFYNKKIEKLKMDLSDLAKATILLERDNKLINNILLSVTKCHLEDDACEGSYESVIERILNDNNTLPITVNNIIKVFEKNRLKKIQAINELLLWSKDKKQKESAFRSLSEKDGDNKSLLLMQKALDFSEEKEVYQQHIDNLVRRLSNGGK